MVRLKRLVVVLGVMAASLAAPGLASAADLAVFGNNAIATELTAAGHSVTLVTDAQLATPGFLDDFDAFVYTRNGFGLGQSLSEAAAANVKAYVRRTVLLNGDFADAVNADPEVAELVRNSVAWAAATGRGYVGEFVGAFAGLTSNSSNFRPLDLVSGSAGPFSSTGFGTIAATPGGAGHPVLNGVALPRDPADVELGTIITGANDADVLARYTANDNPAILAAERPENRDPAATDGSVSTAEDTSVSIPLLGTDPDGDPLTFTVTSGPAHGTYVGGVYTPAANYHGPDEIVFTVSDGRGGTDTGTIAITVTPVNDAPVCAPASFTVQSGVLLTGSVACTDVEGDSLSYELVSGVSHGTLALAANGSFSYTSTPGYVGPDSFSFRARDGFLASEPATASITVTAPPPPPDTTKPACALSATGTDSQGRKYIEVTVRDTGSGLKTVEVLKTTNATTPVPPFTVGSKAALIVRGTKIDQALGAVIELRVTDVAGNVTVCDPTIVTIERDGEQPQTQTYDAIPDFEHWITIYNGDPGVKKVEITVNGVKYKDHDLAPGEQATIDIAAAMRPGMNTITVNAKGKKGATAMILIHDGSGERQA